MCLMGFADLFPAPAFFALSCLSRVFAGAGTACVYTVCTLYTAYAYIASDYPARMNEIIAFTEAISGLGLMVGPVIGSGFCYLAGYQGMFYCLAGVFLVGGFVVYRFVSVDHPYVVADEDENRITALCYRGELIINCLPLVFSMAAVGFCDTVIAPHLEKNALTSEEIGVLWALADSGYAIVSCFLAQSLGLFDLKKVNIAGLAMVFIAYWLLGPWEVLFPQSPTLTIIGLTVISISVALLYIAALPNLINVAVEECGMTKDDILIDSLSGMVSSATSLGEILGPLTAGLIADYFDVPQAGGIMGLVGAGLTALYWCYCVSELRSRQRRKAVEETELSVRSTLEG